MKKKDLIMRFAPSPTGEFHLGNLYILIVNLLFYFKNSSLHKLYLRIDDTDRKRSKVNFISDIQKLIFFFKFQFTNSTPIIQSTRFKLYLEKITFFLKKQFIYKCQCINLNREQIFRCTSCIKMPSKIVKDYVIRVNMKKIIEIFGIEHFFIDILRGKRRVFFNLVEDFVIVKKKNIPSYYLASVVDDIALNINLIIRAEEWLNSTVKHVILYLLFQKSSLPSFLHLPLLLSETGKKISKRDLNSFSIKTLLQKGILKETIINYLFLCLNSVFKTKKEILTFNEMIVLFNEKKILKTSTCFNFKKLEWLNLKHLLKKTNEELLSLSFSFSSIFPENKDDFLIFFEKYQKNFLLNFSFNILTKRLIFFISENKTSYKNLLEIYSDIVVLLMDTKEFSLLKHERLTIEQQTPKFFQLILNFDKKISEKIFLTTTKQQLKIILLQYFSQNRFFFYHFQRIILLKKKNGVSIKSIENLYSENFLFIFKKEFKKFLIFTKEKWN